MEHLLGTWQWIDYKTVSSTNDVAKEIKRQASDLKIVITAETQTDGRGRRGRKWISCDGNLFMSLLIKSERELSELTFIASLSVVQTLIKLQPKLLPELKWPNDVLIKGKKICGILIETAVNDRTVIGIGINLVSAPNSSKIIYPVTSLYEEGLVVSREDFLQQYLKVFDINMNKDFNLIRKQWLQYAFKLGKEICIKQGSLEQQGIFTGIDEQGFLLLKQNDVVQRISVGDVCIRNEK